MEQEVLPQQSNTKNNRNIIPVAISIATSAIIFGLGTYLITKNSFNNERRQLEERIVTLQMQINDLQNKETDSTSAATPASKDSTSDIDNIFANLSKELLRRDSKVPLTPTNGYLITTSIVSNKGDKIVYSEISDCIEAVNKYGPSNQSCDWKYNVFVKNLQTGKINTIYSYPEKTSFLQNLKRIVVNEVMAGGCQLVYFPIAWSKNDQKIILEWGNPTSCGAGGAPTYSTYTLNPAGGNIDSLSTYNPVFLDNYSKVIFVGESSKSPAECGPVSQTNHGEIILKYIENGNTVTLLEEPNSYYSSLSTNPNQTTLNYSVEKVKDVNGCSEVDSSVTKKTKPLQIP